MLKFKIDTDSFDKLNDVEKTFYAQSGDGYQVQIDGAVGADKYLEQKQKTDDFRSNNVDMMKKYEGVDMDEIRELQEQKRKLLDAEFIERKDFDGMKAEHSRVSDANWAAKLKAEKERADNSESTYKSFVSKTLIDGATVEACGKLSIKPSLMGAVSLLVKEKFSVDGSNVIAKNGDVIESGADGNLTVSEYINSLGEDYKIQSSGGNATGNENNKHAANTTAKRDAYAKLLG